MLSTTGRQGIFSTFKSINASRTILAFNSQNISKIN
jgi:taurine--2-oxoglutarate transaminase